MSRFICSECGAISAIRTGKCNVCGSWGTVMQDISASAPNVADSNSERVSVRSVDVVPPERIKSGITELDRVLGGGWVSGGVTLLGGQPGIGKSTLLLQTAGVMAQKGLRVLYISGEESASQVALRARRLGADSENLYLFCSTNLEKAISEVNGHNTEFVVLDSVQAMRAPEEAGWAGTPNQVRAVAQMIVDVAKSKNVPAVLVGHITKEGRLAGPMLLEHMVDTVLIFTGEGYSSYRMLRAQKNRYGTTDELGVFEMGERGLIPVDDKSALYWNRADALVPGVSMTVALEGSVPLIAEIQTLCTATTFSYPRRTARGIDVNKLHLLAAVVEKRASIPCANYDIYLNIAGGLSIQDPSADLAACAAIVSAAIGKPLPPDCCFLGEVGLAGEVRPVTRVGLRLREAAKLGFTNAVISAREKKDEFPLGINVVRVKSLNDAIREYLV
ncbi:MAG: DNA repair protein RadA [Synergistaceae bacterium]|nr:DNA repair protein RadA [Synergistaceae bacterium]